MVPFFRNVGPPAGLGGRNVWTSCLDAHEGPAGGRLTRELGSSSHQLFQVAADICFSDRGVKRKEQKLLACEAAGLSDCCGGASLLPLRGEFKTGRENSSLASSLLPC